MKPSTGVVALALPAGDFNQYDGADRSSCGHVSDPFAVALDDKMPGWLSRL